MKLFSFYFNWLQKNHPTSKPERFPELKNRFETSVPGLYCIGTANNGEAQPYLRMSKKNLIRIKALFEVERDDSRAEQGYL